MKKPTAPLLEIKNWDKYQSPKASIWLKDYADQSGDPDYSTLSLFERGLLQECRRLRTRFSRPLNNDITWIARASCTPPTDRARLQHALDTLVERGFLIPVESAEVTIEKSREEKKREDQKRAEAGKSGLKVPSGKSQTTSVPQGSTTEGFDDAKF